MKSRLRSVKQSSMNRTSHSVRRSSASDLTDTIIARLTPHVANGTAERVAHEIALALREAVVDESNKSLRETIERLVVNTHRRATFADTRKRDAIVTRTIPPAKDEFDPQSETHHPLLIIKAVEPGCTTELQIE